MKRLALPLFLLLAGCQEDNATMRVVDLRVDYETTPMTVESANPRFSWRMETGDGLGSQRAYALEVFAETGESVWTSGEVEDGESVGIAYAGPRLEPSRRYQWQVTVWPDTGEPSSGDSWFETGFMDTSIDAWSGAQWIGGDEHDRVFEASYLSVFKIRFDVQIDRESRSGRAAFLLGGNDFRLMDANLNVHRVQNGENESFFALELDISGLDDPSGQARLHVYRVGHTSHDTREVPFASFPVPTSIVNGRNRYEPHRIYLESMFGVFSVWIDGEEPAHRLTPYDPVRAAFSAQGLPVSPLGAGGNYIAYPMLGDVGFWIKPGENARFSNIEVRHLRAPGNVLFAAGSAEAGPYAEIFLGGANDEVIRRADDGAYEVTAGDEDTIRLSDPSRTGAPMLRGRFVLDDKPVAKARLYATARGIYELYVNGERVSHDYFTPGLTQYNKHHTYQAYDVTDKLLAGADNVIGAWLGEGWWSGNVTYTGSNWNYFGDRQSLLAKLVITYQDGTTAEIRTEPGSWKVFHNGPVRYGSFFQGEVYDARRDADIEGWSTSSYDDSAWQPARVVPLQGSAFIGDPDEDVDGQLITSYEDMQLTGHPGRSPAIVETRDAASVRQARPGVFVYDMGQNMVGFPRIRLAGATPGKPVTLRYAEVLYPELPEHAGLEGTPMMENLRAALVHDIYYPKGGDEVIQPRFTFHGYRYVEISGIGKELPLSAVQGLVVSSVNDFSADYETSNGLVNRLWDNIRWSMRGNFLSIPTDTPARNERMGWSGDISVFARTANYMAHVNPFMTRHLLAMRDLQSPAGRFPDVAPVGGGFGGTLWGSAGVVVAWETYRQYGDLALLRDHYPAMVRYVDYLQSRRDPQSGVLVEGPLGDWLSPEGDRNDNTLLWEAYNVYLLEILAKVAGLLGEEPDAARFRQMHAESMAFFNDTYVDAASGRTVSSAMVQQPFAPPEYDPEARGRPVDTQASYAIPIALGTLDETNLKRAGAHLAETIERENVDDGGVRRPAYSLMTGFIGTAALGDALSMVGRDDLAYRLLQQTSYPSWLYPVQNGATTIWERLNSYTVDAGFGGNNSMNSFNHYAFGAIGGWMLSRSLGIRPPQGSAGYRHFILAPSPDPTGQMTWARGYFDSLHGRIESEWTIGEGAVRYRFVVPENTTATLLLPKPTGAEVKSDADVVPAGDEGSTQIYELGPGTFEFAVTTAPATRNPPDPS